MKVLVTGVAGFIGYHTARRLLERGDHVNGVDNLNDYYDVHLKRSRLKQLDRYPEFSFSRIDLADRRAVPALFGSVQPDRIIHLAAQAGVRYSLENPSAYIDSNLVGFANVLEACRYSGIAHLVYASSSSVYGANKKLPFSVQDNVDYPISLYAATKKANELMAHVYSHLYRLPTTGLRFFTVYGPWGRPDMATFLFTKAILEENPIEVFNDGKMQRDFTYIDDIVEAVVRVLDTPPVIKPGVAPYRIYNIGNHEPVALLRFIEVLEGCLGKKARTVLRPMQPGDVPATYADVSDLVRDMDFHPATPIEKGLQEFVTWYRTYYEVPECEAARA